MQPNGPSPVLPHLGYKPINQGFEKETIGPRPAMVQRPITSDFSAINGRYTPFYNHFCSLHQFKLLEVCMTFSMFVSSTGYVPV